MKPITAETIDPILRPAYLKGWKEGREEGRAGAILSIFETRGFSVTEAQRALVLGCSDGEQLEAWLRRAVVARTVEEALSLHR